MFDVQEIIRWKFTKIYNEAATTSSHMLGRSLSGTVMMCGLLETCAGVHEILHCLLGMRRSSSIHFRALRPFSAAAYLPRQGL